MQKKKPTKRKKARAFFNEERKMAIFIEFGVDFKWPFVLCARAGARIRALQMKIRKVCTQNVLFKL